MTKSSGPAREPNDQRLAESLAEISLRCLHREYPNYTQHLWANSSDICPPRQMHPAFYGCFDWHSAVHNHWALIRILRIYPQTTLRPQILEALNQSFTSQNIAGELEYLNSRPRFEMPYGVAWFLFLCAELRESRAEFTEFELWLDILKPLEDLLQKRFQNWLKSLPAPIRSGEHSQSAFAMGLVYDWAIISEQKTMKDLVEQKSRQFYLTDLPWPFRLEPSAYDFLSPGLAEADLLRRMLDTEVFHSWVEGFLPLAAILEEREWLDPVESVDPTDGKLAHWSGLNLSRAWMLRAISSACGRSEMATNLTILSNVHQTSGINAIVESEYAGSHWLVSFAVYLLTARWRVIPTH